MNDSFIQNPNRPQILQLFPFHYEYLVARWYPKASSNCFIQLLYFGPGRDVYEQSLSSAVSQVDIQHCVAIGGHRLQLSVTVWLLMHA